MENILGRYALLSKDQRVAFLIATAFNITIEFRGLSGLNDSEARTPANGFNELQHKLLSQAAKELSGEERYPDDVFINILKDIAEMNGVSAAIQSALARALKKFEQ